MYWHGKSRSRWIRAFAWMRWIEHCKWPHRTSSIAIKGSSLPVRSLPTDSKRQIFASAGMAEGEPWTTFLRNACADAHTFPLLEESNTTEAKVVKALPDLAVKTKGDSSMERKRSAGGTRSQEDAQARPYRVSPGLGKRQATRCR